MKITYCKDGWNLKTALKDSETQQNTPLSLEMSSNHLFYTNKETDKLRRQHQKDIQKLLSSLDYQKPMSIVSSLIKIENTDHSALTKKPRNLCKLLEKRNIQIRQEVNRYDNGSQSTLTSKTKTTNSMEKQNRNKIQKTNKNLFKGESISNQEALSFAFLDSEIQFIHDDISLDCSMSQFEQLSSEEESINSSQENQTTFLENHNILSDSDDEFRPDVVFKKIRISEYLKKQKNMFERQCSDQPL